MKTPFSSSFVVDGSGFGEFGGDFGEPALGVSRRELIRLDGFDSFWASFSSLKYSSPDENGSGGVTRSGQLWMRLFVNSIHDSEEIKKTKSVKNLSKFKIKILFRNALSISKFQFFRLSPRSYHQHKKNQIDKRNWTFPS